MPLTRTELAPALAALYRQKNRRALVDPDPLACIYRYSTPGDLEIAGLIAAGLAYGRVAYIMTSVDTVLDRMGDSPRAFVQDTSEASLRRSFRDFRHRWTSGEEVSELLVGVKRVLGESESLERAFLAELEPDDDTSLNALARFVRQLSGGRKNSLLPDPAKGAACKRLHLYLRWMVRRDAVDPGCWAGVDPRLLIVPMDTHMHRAARKLRMTRRNQANLLAALDVTRAFRRLCPEDPVRYDFVLTRFGIRSDLSMGGLMDALHEARTAG